MVAWSWEKFTKFIDFSCIGYFAVVDYESSIRFWKFEIADPIWRLGSKKNSDLVLDFETSKWWIEYRGEVFKKFEWCILFWPNTEFNLNYSNRIDK